MATNSPAFVTAFFGTACLPSQALKSPSSCVFKGLRISTPNRVQHARLYMRQDDSEDIAREDAPSDTYVPASEANPTSNPVEAIPKRMSLLKRLLKLSAFTLRGQRATDAQATAVQQIVSTLENMNPTSSPVNSQNINGVWFLVYSDAQLLHVNKLVDVAVKPVFELAQVRQRINVSNGSLITEGDVIVFPATSATITTTARLAPISPERLEVTVEKTNITGGKAFNALNLGVLSFDVPVEQILSRIRNISPDTYFDTSYLDDDILISHSKDGKLYVYTRMNE